MPELPEVEAVRRGIHDQLLHRPIISTELRRAGLIIAQDGLSLDLIHGYSITETFRHGKYLVLTSDPLALVVHLKLAGQVVARGTGIPGFAAGHPVPDYDAELPHKSTHLWIDFEGDARLYLTDIRHFARIWLLPNEEVSEYLRKLRLGPDLLSPDFTLERLRDGLKRRSVGRIKPILLDQTSVAGLGNIYVDEALWQAKIHPTRTAESLTDEEIERIYQGIVDTMKVAVPAGGARIKHSTALTDLGEFPYVHAREGFPCQRCGTPIVKTKVNNRGTYLCPTCQPEP